MKLIVGLGNIGSEYDYTYHNLGFLVLDALLDEFTELGDGQKKFKGLFWQAKLNNKRFALLKPRTFVNRSGESVILAVNFFKINLADLLIVHDDLDMSFGKLRYREKGRHGGHNGIRSIIECLDSENLKRLKIGIGQSEKLDTKNYVLSKIKSEHLQVIPSIVAQSCSFIRDFILDNKLQLVQAK